MHIHFGTSETVHAARLAITIPGADCTGRSVRDVERWVRAARHLFTRLFGGCTCLTGQGMWSAKACGVFIEETSVIVTAYVDVDDVLANLSEIRAFIEAFRVNTNQETVAVEFAGQLHFVGAPAETLVVA